MTVLGPTQAIRTHARANHEGMLGDTAFVYEASTVETPDLGTTTTYTLVGPLGYPATFWSTTGGEALVLQSREVKADATVVLPHDADVTELHEIVLIEGERGQTHHFKVVLVYDRSHPLTIHVACEEYKFEQ